MKQVTYTAIWYQENNQFVISIPDLDNISSFADTFKEAVANITEAAELFLEDLETIPIPKPLEVEVGTTTCDIEIMVIDKDDSAIIAILSGLDGTATTTSISGYFSESIRQVNSIRKIIEPDSPAIFRIFADGKTVKKIADITSEEFQSLHEEKDKEEAKDE